MCALRDYYSGDPYWMRARFASICPNCKREIKKGDSIFYFPRVKKAYCNAEGCGMQEARQFESAAQDEYLETRGGMC